MKLALASDHAGYTLKNHLREYLNEAGHEVLDLGVDTGEVRSDYPDAASVVAQALGNGDAERGILVCGSGVGVAIAANKHKGIYASVAHDTYSAAQGVEHDRMNVICIGAQIVGSKLAEALVMAFIQANPMDNERYTRRFEKMQAIEQGDTSTQ